MCHVSVDGAEGVKSDFLCWRLRSFVNRLWTRSDREEEMGQSPPRTHGGRPRPPNPSCPSSSSHAPPSSCFRSSPPSTPSPCPSPLSPPPQQQQQQPPPHHHPFCLERKGGVRVLMYRECDRRGRKLLYDSQTVQRSALPPETPSSTPGAPCPSRLFRTPPRPGVALPHPTFHPSPISTRSPSPTSPSKLGSGSGSYSSDRSLSAALRHPNRAGAPNRRKSWSGESYIEVRAGFGYQYLKEASDSKQIGELVFGSVALAFRGPSAKLHLLKEPSRILMSRTSRAPRCYRSTQTSCDTGIEDSFSSLSNSLSELQLSKVESLEDSFSRPLLRPSMPLEMSCGGGGGGGGLRAFPSEDDSGFSGPPSPFSSTCGSYLNPASLPCTPLDTPSSRNGSGSSLKSSGSLSSLQRRFLRNVATSLESFGFAPNEDEHRDENRLSSSSYQTKLGLAVIIETKQESGDLERLAEEWWFNQQEILETLVNKLQSALEGAYLHRSKFVSTVYEAVAQLQQELCDLLYAPRLREPLWLSLLGAGTDPERETLHARLIGSLSSLLNNSDTKQTNFFVSKLLTGVLTHHLGWVSTVGPQISSLSHNSSTHKETTSNLTDVLANYLSKTQPYNALWGQLCELMGSIGYPSRVTRTVVVGKDKTLLKDILTLLSYLIRCSQVVKKCVRESDESFCKSNASSRSSLTSLTTVLESSFLKNYSESSMKGSKMFSPKHAPSQTSLGTDSCQKKGKPQVPSLAHKSSTESTKINFEEVASPTKSSSHSTESNPDSKRPNQNPTPVLTTSKTMSNFSSVLGSTPESFSASSFTKFSPSMYPNLRQMEDHKEAFGRTGSPQDLIAEKVQKLCRVPEPSHTSKSNKDQPEIKVTGEKIDLEMEKGGKVLFILGENERLEGLKPKKSLPESVEGTCNLVSVASSSAERSKNTRLSRCSSQSTRHEISALPAPLDFRKINTFRTQGKSASTLDSKPSGQHCPIPSSSSSSLYPSLTELKKSFAEHSVNISRGDLKQKTGHKRNKSDPTNGADLLKMPPYQKGLGVVTEIKEAKKSLRQSSKERTLKESNAVSKSQEANNVKPKKSLASKKEDSILDEWEHIDQHSLVVETPRVEFLAESESSLSVAECLLGGVLDHYSSVFVLQATTEARHLEEQLRADLNSAAQHPVLNAQTAEAVAIVAEIGTWEIELVSSHSYAIDRRVAGSPSPPPVSCGGVPVMISPLVAQISDSLLNLIRIQTPPYFIIQCLEHHLRGVYLKSQLLSEYLLEGVQASLNSAGSYSYLGGQSLYNLSELTQTLGIDLNDLPLLLSVASTHTPALTQMFGLTFK